MLILRVLMTWVLSATLLGASVAAPSGDAAWIARAGAQVALAEAHAKAGNGAKALALIREALPARDGPFDTLNFLLRAGSALPK